MALTVTEVSRNQGPGNRMEVIATVTFDSSYATGGESLTPASLGFQTFDFVSVTTSGGYVFSYDHTNSKVKAYWVDTSTDGAPLAEVASTTDLSAITCRIRAIGY